MRFSLSFSMDDAPFDGGDNSVDEVVRILHGLAGWFDATGVDGDVRGTVLDINGNAIGRWAVIDDE